MRVDAHEDPSRVCRPLGSVGRSLLTRPLIVRLVIWTTAVIVESKTAFGPSAPKLKESRGDPPSIFTPAVTINYRSNAGMAISL